jgi:DedD protein
LNSLIDDEEDNDRRDRSYADEDTPDHAEREISLGTPTILAIFFALALVCAGIFGLGYSMGRKSAQNSAESAAPSDTLAGSGSAKPAAGSLFGQPAAPAAAPTAAATATAPEDSSTPPSTTAAQPDPSQTQSAATSATTPVAPAAAKATPADGMIAGDKRPATTPPPAAANPQPGTGYMVQIAAVSTQEIADIELTALKKDGYNVVIRHEPQDQLLHIQIGPFANRKDAEAMRENVLAHGFNAIVK